MALTNYIMQTILAIIIYYGIGFRVGGNIGPAIFIPIGLAVYLLQIAYSTWWMKHFNYGPLEWIWRMLTYGKTLKIKRENQIVKRVLKNGPGRVKNPTREQELLPMPRQTEAR